MRLEAWADSNIGLVRQTNQDALGCFPEARLFVVADGMGGHAEGGVASALAVETLRAELGQLGAYTPGPPTGWRWFALGRGAKPEPVAWEHALRSAIRAANRRIYVAGREARSPESSQRGPMGTTVVALACDLAERRAHWAHVGDSRLYRIRDGAVTLLTADHTYPGERYWNAAEIPLDLPHTNQLLRAVGIAPDVVVASGGAPLGAGDVYCLCSDGVSGMLDAASFVDRMLAGESIAALGASLIRAALERGGRDNASVLLVRVHES